MISLVKTFCAKLSRNTNLLEDYMKKGITVLAMLLIVSPILAQDWTQWRGPNRDGALASFTEPRTWPAQLTQRWKVEVGLGYATPLVAGDKIYMFSRQGENEVMSALDAATGKQLWQTGYPATFT